MFGAKSEAPQQKSDDEPYTALQRFFTQSVTKPDSPGFSNFLSIEFCEFLSLLVRREHNVGRVGRWRVYHCGVPNAHRQELALDCFCYLSFGTPGVAATLEIEAEC